MKKFKFILSIFPILFFCSLSFADTYNQTISTQNPTSNIMYFDASSFNPTYQGMTMATLISYPLSGISAYQVGDVVIQENLFHNGDHLTYSLHFFTSSNPILNVQIKLTYDDNTGNPTAAVCSVDNPSCYCICNEILGNISCPVQWSQSPS